VIGRDRDLVQAGGGNTSVKSGGELIVKAAGRDLADAAPRDFVRLDLGRLARLPSVRPEGVPGFLRRCQLEPAAGRPSAETPFHSVFPFRFIAHTHDVATLCLTATPDPARRVRRVFGDEVLLAPYARSGWPLARVLMRLRIGARTRGIALEKHGCITWGETARECLRNLVEIMTRAEEAVPLAEVSRVAPSPDLAKRVLAELRKALRARGLRAVFYDGSACGEIEKVWRVAGRGMMTPEHIVWAGPRAVVLRSGALAAQLRRHPGARAFMIPGVGLVTGGEDERAARRAHECIRASMKVMRGAGDFRSLPRGEVRAIDKSAAARRKLEN
jgi:rhamnose utilization protein RhaD (predicted bifunctional aldolase and dehydrogenase)